MSRLVAVHDVEDCFDDSFIKEIEVEPAVDESLMGRLAQGGQLEYHPDFPRPYFQIRKPNAYFVQGVIGSRTFRVTFSREHLERAHEELRQLIEERGSPWERNSSSTSIC